MLDYKKINYVVRSVEIICSLIPNISCLVRASVLKIIFGKTKNLEIFIGIRGGNNRIFKSHAWVTLNDKIILNNDFEIDSYKVIYTI